MAAYRTGGGSAGLTALLQRPNHGGIDFMGFARGAAIADEMNWRDQLRQRDEIDLMREAKQSDDEYAARTYMASMLTNMQVAADTGVDPTDYFIQQREQMMADPAFQNMNAETQHLIMNRMGNSVALQLQALAKAGDLQGARRLSDAFGLTTPVDDSMLAGSSGNYAQQVEAINQKYGSDIQISPDGQTVSMNGMTMPAHGAVAILNQFGNRPESLQQAMYLWNTNADVRAEMEASFSRAGIDRWGNPLSGQRPGAAPAVQPQGNIADLFLPPNLRGQQGQAGADPSLPPSAAVPPGAEQPYRWGGPNGVTGAQQAEALATLTQNPLAAPFLAFNWGRSNSPLWQRMDTLQPGDTATLGDLLTKGGAGQAQYGPFTFRHLPQYNKPSQ